MSGTESEVNGIARQVAHRNDGETSVLSFRVEIRNDDGDTERFCPVEVRSRWGIRGGLKDGDKVYLQGDESVEGTLLANVITNMTTGEIVSGLPAPKGSRLMGNFSLVFIGIVFLIILSGFITMLAG